VVQSTEGPGTLVGHWTGTLIYAAFSFVMFYIGAFVAGEFIFILLTGAPSHTDTFDFKRSQDTPSTIASDTIGGIVWPTSLLPKLGGQLSNVAIVRCHSLPSVFGPTVTGGNPLRSIQSKSPLEHSSTRFQSLCPRASSNSARAVSGSMMGSSYSVPGTSTIVQINQHETVSLCLLCQ
jgi:hypothetical protein